MHLSLAAIDFYLLYDGPIDMRIYMSPSDKKSVLRLCYNQVTIMDHGPLVNFRQCIFAIIIPRRREGPIL